MAGRVKDWKRCLATLTHGTGFESLLKKDPTGQKFLFQCSLDLSHVPADQYILRNPDLSKKISTTIENLFQMMVPAIIPIRQNEFQEKFNEFKCWLLEQTNQMQSYLNIEKTLYPTKLPSPVKTNRVAILFSFFKSRGFNDLDTVEKVCAFLFEAKIVAKPYRDLTEPEITNLKKRLLDDVSNSLNGKKRKKSKDS